MCINLSNNPIFIKILRIQNVVFFDPELITYSRYEFLFEVNGLVTINSVCVNIFFLSPITILYDIETFKLWSLPAQKSSQLNVVIDMCSPLFVSDTS